MCSLDYPFEAACMTSAGGKHAGLLLKECEVGKFVIFCSHMTPF